MQVFALKSILIFWQSFRDGSKNWVIIANPKIYFFLKKILTSRRICFEPSWSDKESRSHEAFDRKLNDWKCTDQKLLHYKFLDQKLLDQKLLDQKLLQYKLFAQKLTMLLIEIILIHIVWIMGKQNPAS